MKYQSEHTLYAEGEPLEPESLLALLDYATNECVGYQDSELSVERRENTEYYDGILPRPTGRNNSTFRSQDVYEAVENAKAAIVDIYSGENGVGRFEPEGPEDVQACAERTAYCDYVVFRQNPGDEIFETLIHDGLMNRCGIIKVHWHEEFAEYEAKMVYVSPDAAMVSLAGDPHVVSINAEGFDEAGNYEVEFTRREPLHQVQITNLAPEEFGIASEAKSIEDAAICYHRWRESRSDLRKNYNLSEEEMERVVFDDYNWRHDAEVLARQENIASELETEKTLQEAAQKTYVYESYVQLDADGTGLTHLHKVTWCRGLVIDVERVKKAPFIAYAPIPRHHTFWGDSFVKRIIPTQNAKTVIVRGILDHTVRTNNPRHEVVANTLKDPRELLDDRFGGFINVSREGGIKPLEQAPLNQFAMPVHDMLTDKLEDTTGISKLATGTSKEVISNQNSEAMIGQLTSLSQKRLKVMAKRFAAQVVKPLYQLVCELVMENETRPKLVNVAGSWTEVNPSSWSKMEDFKIELALGTNEKRKEAEKWLTLDDVLTQRGGPQYTPENKYAVVSKAVSFLGAQDVDNYYSPVPPPQELPPDVQFQMEMAKEEMRIKQAQEARADQRLQFEIAQFEQEHNVKVRREQADIAIRMDQEERADTKLESEIALGMAELEIARGVEDKRGIISADI